MCRAPCPQHVCRNGLSLLEVVVAIGIIALLMAVVAPAVQQARESARRAECTSNLRQIGVALQNWESVHGRFPHGASATFELLPFLDQKSLFDLQVANPTHTHAETVLCRMPMPIYRCPSDDNRAPGSNYCVNIGSGRQKFGYNGYFVVRPGARPTRAADIRDGLSNTAAVSEIITSDASLHRLRTTWDIIYRYREPEEFDLMADYCDSLPPEPAAFGYTGAPDRGRNWCLTFMDTAYNHVLGPNRPSCQNGGADNGPLTAGSFHPGGAQTLYGDGHVTFTANSVDRAVWREIGSRAPGLKEDFP